MPDRASVPPIQLSFETTADPDTAWRTITDPGRVALWLTDASRPGPAGTPYRLDFGDGNVVRGTVTALEPGRRLAYTWAWEGAEEGDVTRVEWTVEPLEGGGSRVGLVHDGWADAGGNVTARDEHEGYWTGYLDDLRDVLEEA